MARALPSGRGSLPAEATRFLQRARILDATAVTIAEGGYASASIDGIRTRAGVSARTFYEHFTGKGDAALWAFDAAATYAVPRIIQAFRAQEHWAAGVDAALGAYLAMMDCDRAWAVLCLVELPASATGTVARRRELLAPLVATLEAGPAVDAVVSVPGVIAAIDGVLRAHLLRDEHGDLQGLRDELLALALGPYLGPERSRRWIEQAPADPLLSCSRRRAERAAEVVKHAGDPQQLAELERVLDAALEERDGAALWRIILGIHDLRTRRRPVPWTLERRALDGLAEASFFGMPLRDMERGGWEVPSPAQRVLAYVGEHPGCSGQEIREALGFAHLSQASRVLSSLHTEGLVALRRQPGRANAWVLTAPGNETGVLPKKT